ncbi:hypothetical protein KC319_g26 [Hortaea werneckii]|nr:hypothetical protein KC319_g26 [Hortaea werneckii]
MSIFAFSAVNNLPSRGFWRFRTDRQTTTSVETSSAALENTSDQLVSYLIDGIRSFANQDIDLESVETNLRRLHHLLSADARYHVDDSFCDDFYLAHDVEVLTEMQRKASAYTKADPEGYELADETMTRTSLCAQPTRLLFELPTGELSIRNANTATETEKVRLTDLLLPELSSMPQPAASQENSEGKEVHQSSSHPSRHTTTNESRAPSPPVDKNLLCIRMGFRMENGLEAQDLRE